MLATLTTIAPPRCNEGVEIPGNVGRALGPLFMVIFTSTIQMYLSYYYEYVLRFPMQSVQLGEVSDISLKLILFHLLKFIG